MKTTSYYFPFFIISLFLYGFLFLYIDQPKSITILPLNSGKQSIQVRFISQPNLSEENIAQPNEQLRAVKPPVAVDKIQPEKVITSQSEVKLKNQALQESAAKNAADSAANLAAEIFHPQAASDEIMTKEVSPLPKASSSTAKKRVVKKHPENSSSAASSMQNQGVLQEAIVVSGRKPVYPQRAILRNQQGRVVVRLTVTKKGLPKNPKIQTSSGFSILDNAVLVFINQELFMPALQGEDKVISEQLFAFRFELN